MWSRINTQSKKKQRQYEVQPKVTLFTFFDIKFEVGTLYNYITSNTDNQFTHFSKGGGDSSVSTEFSETLLQLHNVSCQISLWNGCKSLEKSLTHLQQRKNLWKFTRSFQSLFACTGVMCGCVCVCVAHVCVKLSTVCRSTSGLFQRLQKHLDYCSRLVDVCDWHGKICNKWAEAHHSFAPKIFLYKCKAVEQCQGAGSWWDAEEPVGWLTPLQFTGTGKLAARIPAGSNPRGLGSAPSSAWSRSSQWVQWHHRAGSAAGMSGGGRSRRGHVRDVDAVEEGERKEGRGREGGEKTER